MQHGVCCAALPRYQPCRLPVRPQALEEDAAATQARMDSANALIHALGGEEVRWTAMSRQFDETIARLTSDCAVASRWARQMVGGCDKHSGGPSGTLCLTCAISPGPPCTCLKLRVVPGAIQPRVQVSCHAMCCRGGCRGCHLPLRRCACSRPGSPSALPHRTAAPGRSSSSACRPRASGWPSPAPQTSPSQSSWPTPQRRGSGRWRAYHQTTCQWPTASCARAPRATPCWSIRRWGGGGRQQGGEGRCGSCSSGVPVL